MSEWIACNEKLPENGMICLACGNEGGMRVARYRDLDDSWTVVGAGKRFNAVAWMFLPEPYKIKEKNNAGT